MARWFETAIAFARLCLCGFETAIAFARLCLCGIETAIAFARLCLCGIETVIAFAGEKWAFLAHFVGAEVMSVSVAPCWGEQWCCWFQRRHAVAPFALSFWGALVCVVTNVVDLRAFSLKMVGFGLRLTTFVTEVLARRFESRWFDDVCNVGRPPVAGQALSTRWPGGLKPLSPLLARACVGLKPPSPLRARNGRFWCSFRAQR